MLRAGAWHFAPLARGILPQCAVRATQHVVLAWRATTRCCAHHMRHAVCIMVVALQRNVWRNSNARQRGVEMAAAETTATVPSWFSVYGAQRGLHWRADGGTVHVWGGRLNIHGTYAVVRPADCECYYHAATTECALALAQELALHFAALVVVTGTALEVRCVERKPGLGTDIYNFCCHFSTGWLRRRGV